MTSVLRFMKQTPVDTQYFVATRPIISLNYFTPDANSSTTSYVSGAAAGTFASSNVTVNCPFTASDPSGAVSGLSLFRDMGKTIISSGRMFRRVQLLNLDGAGQTGWTAPPGAGVWEAGVEGVQGTYNPTATADINYGVFYFETGARGLGIAQGLIRYG